MYTAYITHPDCRAHDLGAGHPESPARLAAIEDRLIACGLFDFLQHFDAPLATLEQLARVHRPQYLAALEALAPQQGLVWLDDDTALCPATLPAARRAAGAAVLATDLVLAGRAANAFCAVRPPGHHAGPARAMGFSIFNNLAVGVAHALEQHGLERVAIADFDVHHGNGTEEIFRDDPRVLFCSTFQHPFYPHLAGDGGGPRAVGVPLPAGSGGEAFRAAVSARWLPALENFRPQLVFVSAGFDAHREDDMAGLNLTEADYRWVTEQLRGCAERHAHGRLVSVLEGGYALDALARSVAAHLRVLAGV